MQMLKSNSFILSVIVLISTGILLSYDLAYLLLATPIVYLIINFILKSTQNWLIVVVYTLPLWLNLSDKGINPIDVIVIIILLFGLAIWFFNRLFISKKSFINNIADWLILFFSLMMLVFMTNGVLFGDSDFNGSLGSLVKTYVILLYFPLKEEFNSKEKIKLLTKHLLISLSLFFVFWGLINYYKLVTATNIYQVTRFNRTNQETFVAGIVFGTLFFLSEKKANSKIAFGILVITSGIALILTLSRVYWLTTILGLVFMFFFFETRKKINLSILFLSLFSALLIGINLISPGLTDYLIDFLVSRFERGLNPLQDDSFLARFDEWDKWWLEFKIYAFGGVGLNTNFSYYSTILSQDNWVSSFIHNGYLHLTYKAGIPMAIIYFFVLFYYMFKAYFKILKQKNNLAKNLFLGSGICLSIFLIVNLITSTWESRPGAVYLAFMLAFINIAQSIEKNDRQ